MEINKMVKTMRWFYTFNEHDIKCKKMCVHNILSNIRVDKWKQSLGQIVWKFECNMYSFMIVGVISLWYTFKQSNIGDICPNVIKFWML